MTSPGAFIRPVPQAGRRTLAARGRPRQDVENCENERDACPELRGAGRDGRPVRRKPLCGGDDRVILGGEKFIKPGEHTEHTERWRLRNPLAVRDTISFPFGAAPKGVDCQRVLELISTEPATNSAAINGICL